MPCMTPIDFPGDEEPVQAHPSGNIVAITCPQAQELSNPAYVIRRD